jgi:predicted nucleic acid-binding protein
MKRARIYVDTSVIGGAFDREFEAVTEKFFAQSVAAGNVIVISDLTLSEISDAPENIQAQLLGLIDALPEANKETAEQTQDTFDLAESYVRAGVVGGSSLRDAQHIAVASVSRVDLLVSWNFKHIVNWNKIKGYNSVNLGQGYPLLEIRSPREVTDEDFH